MGQYPQGKRLVGSNEEGAKLIKQEAIPSATDEGNQRTAHQNQHVEAAEERDCVAGQN